MPRAAVACSPALRLDQRAERAAFYAAIARPPYLLWGLSVAAALAWLVFMRRRPIHSRWAYWLAALLLGLAILQPAWWMDPMRGDCGMARDLAALGVASMSMLLVGVGGWRVRVAPPTSTHTSA
jgi:hypothetical protein